MSLFGDRYRIRLQEVQGDIIFFIPEWKPWYGISWRLIEPARWEGYTRITHMYNKAGCNALISEHMLCRAYVGV